MTKVYLAPVVSCLLLLALHFFRNDNMLAMLLSILMISFVFIRRPWAARMLQICLLLGAAEWIRTTIFLAAAKNETGEPFLRLVIILGAVSLFTLLSSFVFQTERLKTYFRK